MGRASCFGFLCWTVSMLSADADLFFPLAASISFSPVLVVQMEDLFSCSNSLDLGLTEELTEQMEDLLSSSNSFDLGLAEELTLQMEDLSC